MPLTLALDGGGGAGRQTRTLSQGTLSIGRAPGNDWVLDDPDRQLSKTHCVIVASGGHYILTDLSTNGVYVNGASERIPRESQIELTDGDDFRIGEYVIRVSETDLGAAHAGTGGVGAMGGGAMGAAGAGFAAGHVPFVPGGVARADPFADPGDLTPDPLDDVFGAASSAPFVHPIAAPSPQVRRTNDPFDQADDKVAAHQIDPDDDLFQGITPSDQWQGPSQADNVDAQRQAFAAPKIAPANFDDLDFDALLGDTPPGQPAAAQPFPPTQPFAPAQPFASPQSFAPTQPFAPTQNPTPAGAPHTGFPNQSQQTPASFDFENELPPTSALRSRAAGPFDLEPMPPPTAAVATPPVNPASGAPPPDSARLLAAFLEGAGVATLAVGPDPERTMREAGAVFHALVEGIRQVLISRASIKNELRVEQTMLRAKDNNALKFAVTTEDAIAALLQPSRPGYKLPLDATVEAFDDVRSHEMAVMAGVQTALMGLLKRFEPAALEKRLEPGMLGSILPSARKARTWELFCATYNAIATEAQEDFHSVFGREFARAYDAQMQKL